MLKKIFSIVCLSAILLSPFVFSAPESSSLTLEKEVHPVQVHLLSENQTIQPGTPFWVGVEVHLEKGWDTYWINPGDSGFPINIKWDLPEGYHVAPIQWPYPERFTSQSLVGFGYTHSVILLAEITPPKNISQQETTLSAQVSWLACKEQCVPGNAEVALTLPIKADLPQKDDKVAAQFLKARQEIPQKEEHLHWNAHDGGIILTFKQLGDISEAFFVPETLEVIDHAAPQILKKADGDGYTLDIKRMNSDKELPNHLKGVLVISEKGSELKRAIQVDAAMGTASESSHSSFYRFEMALLCAFVGGMILNIMPCVLPVISLKIFSFIKMAEQKRGEIFKQGVQFTAGVLISFWALSALLLLLRASGESIGWGFQLQEPTFVIILILILFLLGLSLFGLFELGTSLMSMGDKISSKNSFLKGSFMNGVLATLVATPCTGPLLGPALGLAMTLPSFSSLIIFTMMGLGMAAPYLIISAFPKLIRYLPRPGNWMVIFKQFMGFLMMGTCAWLIWVFAGQTDHLALLVLLITLLIFSIGAWIYGRWGTILSKKRTRYLATGISLLMILGGGSFSLKTIHSHRQSTEASESPKENWEAYSADKVATLRQQGKAVFVDFTAKWCLICQANKMTLHSAEIQKAFHEKNVVAMEADWTMRDAEISEALHKLGRSGVPVYVLYPADVHKPPHILPQTLTKSIVQDYLKKIDKAIVNVD